MPTGYRALIFVSVALLGMRLCALTNGSFSAQTLATPPFYRTSFDCAKAQGQSIEEAICKNEQLARLDVEMTQAYKERLNSVAESEREQVIASQRRWLAIRNAHNVNPYHGDPPGELADLSDFYGERIAALRSSNPALLKTGVPEEYAWLRAITPEGFSKEEFSIGRAYAGCDDPCQKNPALYRWISIGGSGIGEEPGDVDTPYDELAKKLVSEGWSKCREASDSGKPLIEYFTKGSKMALVSRYYSMGVGNGIGVGITISDPLPQSPPKAPPNPVVTVTPEWQTYSNPELGLSLKYPPGWKARSMAPASDKYTIFQAPDFSSFRITTTPKGTSFAQPSSFDGQDSALKCFPAGYLVSGFPAKLCVLEGEQVSEGTCDRYVQFVSVEAEKYQLRFDPGASYPDSDNRYRLTDLYEKILSTIQIR